MVHFYETNMGDETGTALAGALKENTALQSVDLDFRGSSMGDETGTALAAALKENTELQSVKLALSEKNMGALTAAALAGALKENTALKWMTLNWPTPLKWVKEKTAVTWVQGTVAEMLQRNRELPGHWLAVACFAHSAFKRVRMPEKDLRRSLFGFFLPGGAAPRRGLEGSSTSYADGLEGSRSASGGLCADVLSFCLR